MTDPTLPRRTIVPVPPQPGLLRAVRAEARRRRVRRLQLAGATGSTALVAVLALAIVRVGGTTVGLEPVTPPPLVESAAPSPAGLEQVLPSLAPVASTEVAPDAVPRPGQPVTAASPSALGGGSSASRPAAVRPTDAAPSPAATRPRPPISRSERDAGVQPPCTAGTAVPDWCLAAVVDSGDGGERSTLQLIACPTDRTADQALTFPRSEETRFVVSQDARAVWSSDDGGSSASQHVVAVTSGRCAVWSVEWDQADDAGSLVAPGSYTLTATSYAAEVADAPSSTVAFTVGGDA